MEIEGKLNIKPIVWSEFFSYQHLDQPIAIVFLNTLEPGCDPEMPGLQAVYEKYKDHGLVVFGIGVGSSRPALRNYTGRFGGLNFPQLSDWEHTVARDYEVGRVPTNVFIRKNGKIWQVSPKAMNGAQLDAMVATLFNMP